VRERQRQQAGVRECRAEEPPEFLYNRLPPLPTNGSSLTAPGAAPRFVPPKNDPAWAAWDEYPNLRKRYPEGIPAQIPDADAIDLALGSLDGNNRKELKKYATGIFTLERPLVEAFQKNGFVWGATFSNQVDLMHFEVPAKKGA